jgi:hypothetical protein
VSTLVPERKAGRAVLTVLKDAGHRMTTTRILTELSRRAVDDVAYKFSERTILRQEGAAGSNVDASYQPLGWQARTAASFRDCRPPESSFLFPGIGVDLAAAFPLLDSDLPSLLG